MRYDRGGTCLKTGIVGKLNVVRQTILAPGEIIRPSVTGRVRLTALRERESTRIHARLEAFMMPLRWLWDGWPKYIADGPAGTATIPVHDVSSTGTEGRASDFGVGGDNATSILKFYRDAPLRVYNEWWKWPEDDDATAWEQDGLAVTNLATSWTRIQKFDQIQEADHTMTLPTSRKLDTRALAEQQARYRQAVDQDWLSHGRYVDYLRAAWNANGSREVDKVPVRLRGDAIGVDPQNLYATDADGLGASASFYNFGVDHSFGRIAAPEHCIITYFIALRFSPVAEDEASPLAATGGRDWANFTGEPGILAAQRPQSVTIGHFQADPQRKSNIGYLPAGWQWRARWNCVGTRIDRRNSFPIIRSISGASVADLRDASRIGEPFLSASLGDYLIDLNFREPVDSPIPGPRSSLMTGAGRSGRGSAYPYPGPRRVI